ncbi:MAG TPA: BlaI/MecI/CopY family transcriptional regulator [Longimicrobium sp.]|nr:BlaI/MecI/CopY family transcriptional regulator [Longimicrobium sp.]
MLHDTPPIPTDAELGILQVLWARGPQTVREVHDVLAAGRRLTYTTVLKLLQIMLNKGLVLRDESGRSHLYHAAVPQPEMERMLVADLADRAFGGSPALLAMRALAAERATPEEIARIMELLRREGAEEEPR